MRTLSGIRITQKGQLIEIWVRAPSFLHHMVRNIVGSLVYVGKGKWTPGHMKKVLAARDRRRAGPTAPAAGLYLVRVRYAARPLSKSRPNTRAKK